MDTLNTTLLWDDPSINSLENPPSITPYLLEEKSTESKPVILVIPGGGYGCVCSSSEGAPIAKRFNQLGFSCFVLNYRVAPHHFPCPIQDAARAVRLIRFNAKKLNLDSNKIIACGFSAGGHLAGSLGVLKEEEFAYKKVDAADDLSYKPDGLILNYPVVTFESETGHLSSGKNLLGPNLDQLKDKYRLDLRVSKDTPPTFIWHTVKDQMVGFKGSVNFALAASKENVPCQLQLYPYGDHGMLLGHDTYDVSSWSSDAVNFFKTQWRLASEGEEAFHQHYTNKRQIELEPTWGDK